MVFAVLVAATSQMGVVVYDRVGSLVNSCPCSGLLVGSVRGKHVELIELYPVLKTLLFCGDLRCF